MKTKMSFWHVLLVCITAMVLMCVSACDHDDPIVTPNTDPDPKNNGEVTFTINLPGQDGNGSSSAPAVVQNGDTLNMAISQKSMYTDPDGTVITCEPKASIKLFAVLDTVYAKDIESLTKVKEGSEIKTTTTGTYPVSYQTLQTFNVGGQDIVFDLSHQVFTVLNSENKKIEMPYIKINQAKLGSAGATEGTRSVVSIAGVTVRPLIKTRGTVIRDSTMFEVNSRFNIEIESMNAKEDKKQTLEFSVSYVGVVETVTELDDPTNDLSYVWDVKSGTSSSTSPFVRSSGKTMEVWMSQTSSYSDEYSNKTTAEPKAKIKLTVEKDTVWAKTLDELKAFANKTTSTPTGQAATQIFGSDLQTVNVEWSYETAEGLIGSQNVSMPYYALSPVTLKDATVKEIEDKNIAGKEATVYEITATFTQKATAQNLISGTSEVDIEYVVKYVGAIEITLVKVEYVPTGIWIDPHDNMLLMFFAKVERYRTYSNGKRVGPDEFYDFGHPTIISAGIEEYEDEHEYEDGFKYTVYPAKTTNTGDSICICTQSIEVSEIRIDEYTLLPQELIQVVDTISLLNFDKYISSRYLDESTCVNLKDFDNQIYPADSRKSGWYFQGFHYAGRFYVGIPGVPELTLYNDIWLHDQFFVIDGRRIDFSKLHNLKMDFDWDHRDFSNSDKFGTIFSSRLKASYLGKNFYSEKIDTIFVHK